MAVKVLNHYWTLDDPSVPALVQGAHHDLESFLWVLVHAMYTHEIVKAEVDHKKANARSNLRATAKLTRLRHEFRPNYASVNPAVILVSRYAMLGEHLPGLPRGSLLDLVHAFQDIVRKQTYASKSIVPVTHDEALGVFDRRIEALRFSGTVLP